MIQTKVKINLGNTYDEVGHVPLIPVAIPNLKDIKALAWEAHARNEAYEDEAWGWPVSYTPEIQEAIPHSRMQFQPAVFTIGIYPIWFVSFTWEYGKDQQPSVLIEDENLESPEPSMAVLRG
jgi:hypothetical protein